MRSALVSLCSAAVCAAAALGAAVALGSEPPVDDSRGAELARPESVPALLAAFATMPGLEAEFVEEKTIGLLAAPLVSSGRLYFSPPGLLARHVEAPRASQVVVTPERVTFSDDAGTEVMQLDSRPELRALVESMVWLLAGNFAALDAAWASTLSAEGDNAWRLVLTPRNEPLTHLIARMEVRGRGLMVSEIEVVETTGDTALTRITSADPARTFGAQERERLFGATP